MGIVWLRLPRAVSSVAFAGFVIAGLMSTISPAFTFAMPTWNSVRTYLDNMSDAEFIFALGVVAALAGYLYFKHLPRLPDRFQRHDPAKWTGHGIDVTKLRPKVEGAHRNPLSAGPPARGVCFHRFLLDLARRGVARMTYFERKESDPHRSSSETHR